MCHCFPPSYVRPPTPRRVPCRPNFPPRSALTHERIDSTHHKQQQRAPSPALRMRPRLHRDQERDPPPHPDKGGPMAPYQEKYRIFSGAGSESPLPSSYYSRSTQMPQPSHCLIFYARASPKRDSTSSRSVPADDAMQMPLILGAPEERR